ncbi:flagellar biosynthesis protein [Aliiroseovarius sp.]|uniref:flagellar biosynthesis protein n=1 Tax=Aliiroseovarius sp. TaxID=1872442 RepID=UPI0026111C1D|nr:flagellar biosynthesis protein [Aliiroseovarius sp.]
MKPVFPLEEFDAADLSSSSANPKPAAAAPPPSPTPTVPVEEFEKVRLEGYESGYQAGWDDATRADSEGQSRIGAEFARNLQDLGFTFHEARSHVMHALEPLLTGMVEKVLPQIISQTVGQTIIEELLPLASDAADTPIEVVICPTSRPALETLLSEASSVPFVLREEDSLAEGQVFLRSGKSEKHLDLTGAVDRIGNAINGLYELNEKAFQNG